MNNEYKLSGKPGNILLTGLLISPILAILISIIYAYIDVYNPIVYFTLLVYIGYLVAIVLIQKLVIRLAKCRDTKSASIYGLIVGFFAIYANWCTFIFVLIQKEDYPIELFDLLSNPKEILDIMNSLSIDGYYTLFGMEVKGGFLWFIWIIESIGILLAGIAGGLSVMDEEVFCEDCNRWTEDINFNQRLSNKDETTVRSAIDHDLKKLLSIPFAEENESPHIRVNLHHCSKCQNLSTIDVDLIKLETNKKGEVEEEKEDYSPVFILSKQDYQNIIARGVSVSED